MNEDQENRMNRGAVPSIIVNILPKKKNPGGVPSFRNL
jgi:hypothetical protein